MLPKIALNSVMLYVVLLKTQSPNIVSFTDIFRVNITLIFFAITHLNRKLPIVWLFYYQNVLLIAQSFVKHGIKVNILIDILRPVLSISCLLQKAFCGTLAINCFEFLPCEYFLIVMHFQNASLEIRINYLLILQCF